MALPAPSSGSTPRDRDNKPTANRGQSARSPSPAARVVKPVRSYERFFWAAIASAIACFADNENRANVAIVTVTIVFFFYFPKRVKAVVAIYIAAAGVSNIDHGLPLPDELTNVAKWFYLVPPCVVVWIPIVAPMVVLSEGAYANYLKSLAKLVGLDFTTDVPTAEVASIYPPEYHRGTRLPPALRGIWWMDGNGVASGGSDFVSLHAGIWHSDARRLDFPLHRPYTMTHGPDFLYETILSVAWRWEYIFQFNDNLSQAHITVKFLGVAVPSGSVGSFKMTAQEDECVQTTVVTCADATTAGCKAGVEGGFADACACLADSAACLAVDADTNTVSLDCTWKERRGSWRRDTWLGSDHERSPDHVYFLRRIVDENGVLDKEVLETAVAAQTRSPEAVYERQLVRKN